MKKLFILLSIVATFSVAGYSQPYHYDVDGDGNVTASDVTAIYNYMLGNVPPPATHEYVDLGLPSGTLWATMNVGANSVEEYGDYFAWGETEPKEYYLWETYKWSKGSNPMLTKYCNDGSYGYNGYIDNKLELDPEDDAATANWGAEWRMPSLEQVQELLNNCTSQYTTKNDVDGLMFISNINGSTLFLPGAGDMTANVHDHPPGCGYYWTRKINANYALNACALYFDPGQPYWSDFYYRRRGYTVRAVRVSQTKYDMCSAAMQANAKSYNYDVNSDGNVTAADVTALYNYMLGNLPTHDYVDLGLPSGTLWATTNVGASVPEEHGGYFAWGEVTPKDVYSWSNYKWCKGSRSSLTKYCTDGTYGYNGYIDNITELDPEDDTATANWGPEWRMPSVEQFQELVDNCNAQWTTRNGVDGCLFTSYINDASLFLPTGGYKNDGEINEAWLGFYWSRTLKSENYSNANSNDAYTMHFGLDYSWCSVGIDSWGRQHGRSIRPVRVSQK